MAILPWQVQNIKKPERFTIEDQVLSSLGVPVKNARVLISRKSAALADGYIQVINRNIRTDGNGVFKIEDLPAGEYTLQVAGNNVSSKRDITITNANKINSNRVNTAITPAKIRANYMTIPTGEKIFRDFSILTPGKGYSTLNPPKFTFPGNLIVEGVVDKNSGELTGTKLISTPAPVPITFNDQFLPGAAAVARLASQSVMVPPKARRMCNYETLDDYMATANWNPGSLPDYVWHDAIGDASGYYEEMYNNGYNHTDGDAFNYFSDPGYRGNFRNPVYDDKYMYGKPYWVSQSAHPDEGFWVLADNYTYPDNGGVRKHAPSALTGAYPFSPGTILNKRYIVDVTEFQRDLSSNHFLHRELGYKLPKHYYQDYTNKLLWNIPGLTYSETSHTWSSDGSGPDLQKTSIKGVPSNAWILEKNHYPSWHKDGHLYSGNDYTTLPWIWDDCEYYTPVSLHRLKNPTMGSYVQEVNLTHHRGSGYAPTETPGINLVGGGGWGATAEWDQEDLEYMPLIIDSWGGSNGKINPSVRIKVTNGGQGYTSPPEVQIDNPLSMSGAPYKTVVSSDEEVTHDVSDPSFSTVTDSTGDYGTWTMDMDPDDSQAWFNSIKDLTMSDDFMKDHGIYAGYALTSWNEDPDTGIITTVYSNAEGDIITQVGTEIELGSGQPGECVWPTCGTPPGPCPITNQTVGGGADSSIGAGDGLYPATVDTLAETLAADQTLDSTLDEKGWFEENVPWIWSMGDDSAPPPIKRAESLYDWFAYIDGGERDFGLGAESAIEDNEPYFNQIKGYLGHKMLVQSRMDYLTLGIDSFTGGIASRFLAGLQLIAHNAGQSTRGEGTWGMNTTDLLEQNAGMYEKAPKYLWGKSKTYYDEAYTGDATKKVVTGWDDYGNFYQNFVPK